MNINPLPSNEVHPSHLSFRWVHGYYGGVLAGFVTWKGKLCYFHLFDATTDARRFTIHSLSSDEAHMAVREYEKFKAHGGNHNDLLPDGSHAGRICRTTLEESAAAGDAYAVRKREPTVPYHLSPIIGWFTSTSL